MVRKGFKLEWIINRLREAEVLLSQGATVDEGQPMENLASAERPRIWE